MKNIEVNTADWKAKRRSVEYDEKRESMVTAAAELLDKKGVGGLRLDEVAKLSGYARSSVYRYFDSKNELVLAVLSREFIRLMGVIWNQVKDMEDPVEQVLDSIYLCIQHLRADEVFQEIWRGAGNSLMEVTLRLLPPAMEGDIAHIFLKEARKQGSVRDNVSNEDALRWLLMIISSYGSFTYEELDVDTEKSYIRKMLLPSLFNLQ